LLVRNSKMDRKQKKRLSKNILQMKFMKRTKERTEVEIENEERQAIYANHITTAMRDQGSRFVINPSFASVEDLNFGRMAFLGMNSEIEAMQAREKARLDEKEGLKNEKDVQDDEMAAHFSQNYQHFSANHTPLATTPQKHIPSKLMSDADAEALIAQGGDLLKKIKANPKKFLKPQDF